MAVQQTHGMPQMDPAMIPPRGRVPELQRSDINQMSSGQLAKALGVAPEDRDSWNKLMRDINRSRSWTEIPPTNSDALRSVMGEVLQTELGMKYFPSHNIHQNYYELLRKTLYWKQVRLDYPTPKSGNQGSGNLTASGKKRGRPPKYNVPVDPTAPPGQPTALAQQPAPGQPTAQQETPTAGKKRKRDTIINDSLAQNHSAALTESPLLDYGSAALGRDPRFLPATPTQYYRLRVASPDGKISRHAFPQDQNFVDVLEEVAASRGWSGEQVELHVHDPNTGEEYRLTGDNQESEWRFAATTENATFTLVHKFSPPGLNSVGLYGDRLTAGALGAHHGARDR